MEIFVDADACPVKEIIIEAAKKFQIPVTMIMDTAHTWEDSYCRIINVDKGSDSADFFLLSMASEGDLAITQDYGLAAMLLGKGLRVLNQNGFQYTDENIDRLLFERHLGKRLRLQGKRTKGPKKRSEAEDSAFRSALYKILNQ